MVILGGIDMYLLIINGIKFDKNEMKCILLNVNIFIMMNMFLYGLI